MARLIKVGETDAVKRRVYFDLRLAPNGTDPAEAEAGGQPQISINGAAWTNTGIGTLTHIGNGRYYAELASGSVVDSGRVIETRYKSVNTLEMPGETLQIVGFDPNDPYLAGTGDLELTVKLVDNAAKPIASHEVSLWNGDGSALISPSKPTNASGIVRFYVPAGTYRIVVRSTLDYQAVDAVSVTLSASKTETITLTPASSVELGQIPPELRRPWR